MTEYFESQFYRIWGKSLEILIIGLRSMGSGIQGQNFELLSSEVIDLFTPHHKHSRIFQINPYYSTVFILLLLFFTLQYYIDFAIHQHESSTGVHVFPILNPSPSSIPVPSLWVASVYQPQASSIMPWTWTGYSFHIWYWCGGNGTLVTPVRM